VVNQDNNKQENKDHKGFLSSVNAYLKRNRVGEILVARGKLSPAQLKEALGLQKEQKVPIGRVLLNCGLISRRELHFALATQSTLRTIVTIVTLFGGLTTMSSKSFAGSFKDIPQSISVAFSNVSAGSMTGAVVRSTPLFGTGERASTDMSSFTKWSAMFDRFSSEVSNGSSNDVIQKWRSNLAPLSGLPLTQMANEVNNMMNKVRYIGDQKNWGKSDYWETPIEFMTYGGDCEDFAIAKYVSLRALGVPDRAMRVAIVKDTEKNIAHAILIVYTEDGPMVLDNQIKSMTEASAINHYKPIYSINRTAWWLHTDGNSSNPTQIASASR
jgi:predicted transglutaminase-like cysteine proteinase